MIMYNRIVGGIPEYWNLQPGWPALLFTNQLPSEDDITTVTVIEQQPNKKSKSFYHVFKTSPPDTSTKTWCDENI